MSEFLEENKYVIMIYSCCLLGFIWSLVHTFFIKSIEVSGNKNNDYKNLVAYEKLFTIESIGQKIANGADAFLIQEYSIMSIFIVIFSIIIFFVVDVYGDSLPGIKFYATISFIIGSVTSLSLIHI